MRDNYRENKRIPLGAVVHAGPRRAEHERMARKDFWKSDWFLRLGAIAVLLLSATDLVGSPERKAHGFGRPAFTRERGGDIAAIAIAIDDPSITNARPWPCDAHAQLIESLRGAQVKVTG